MVASAGGRSQRDPDDWFDEPDVSDAATVRFERFARAAAATADEDDWIRSEPEAPRLRRPPLRGVLAVGALAAGLLVAVLAAVGVFSGGGSPATVPTTAATVSTPTVPAAATPSKRTPAVPAAPLKPGDSGAAVTSLQRALGRAGYSPGTVDGKYGDATRQAVTRFQQAVGLTADGVAGPQTLASLARALKNG